MGKTVTVFGDVTETITGNHELHITIDNVTIGENQHVNIGGNVTEVITGSQDVTINKHVFTSRSVI